MTVTVAGVRSAASAPPPPPPGARAGGAGAGPPRRRAGRARPRGAIGLGRRTSSEHLKSGRSRGGDVEALGSLKRAPLGRRPRPGGRPARSRPAGRRPRCLPPAVSPGPSARRGRGCGLRRGAGVPPRVRRRPALVSAPLPARAAPRAAAVVRASAASRCRARRGGAGGWALAPRARRAARPLGPAWPPRGPPRVAPLSSAPAPARALSRRSLGGSPPRAAPRLRGRCGAVRVARAAPALPARSARALGRGLRAAALAPPWGPRGLGRSAPGGRAARVAGSFARRDRPQPNHLSPWTPAQRGTPDTRPPRRWPASPQRPARAARGGSNADEHKHSSPRRGAAAENSESRQSHVGRTPNPQANAPTRWMGGWKVLAHSGRSRRRRTALELVRRQHRW